MTPGVVVLVVVLVVATGFGLYRAASDGRFRGTHRVRGAESPDERDREREGGAGEEAASAVDPTALDLVELGASLGERATLLQFSSAFCAPCRATRQVLGEVADVVPGVAHVEVDAESHLDLVRRVGVLRTPTTLVLDARGVEQARASGALRKHQVMTVLADVVGD